MKKVGVCTIYCDGACEGNPGPGGWASVLKDEQYVQEIHGGMAATTNNRMELQAVLEALRALKEPFEVTLFTDSQYVRDGMSEWLEKWKARRWRTRGRKSVKNQELYVIGIRCHH
jgi:ribonuclease HI